MSKGMAEIEFNLGKHEVMYFGKLNYGRTDRVNVTQMDKAVEMACRLIAFIHQGIKNKS